MPVETDAYAYLRIIGSGSVDLISKQMRLEPDAGWSEGDPRSRGRGNYTFSNWELLSGEKKDFRWTRTSALFGNGSSHIRRG